VLDRKTLKSVTNKKLKAAKILYGAGDYDTAGYLLGYVVECSLKAIVCKTLNLKEYPDTGRHQDVFASHSFDRLLTLSGYSKDLNLSKNKDLNDKWSTLTKDWKPETRYNEGVFTKKVIEEKIEALEDSKKGFMAWVKTRW